MDTILSGFRYAVRGLFKNPSVSIIAVVALALGIGFTTVMFSIVYGALYRGLPFDGAESIMHLERANPTADIQSMEVTIHDYRDWRERQRSFDHLAAFYQGTVNIRGSERPERFDGLREVCFERGREPLRRLAIEAWRHDAPGIVVFTASRALVRS